MGSVERQGQHRRLRLQRRVGHRPDPRGHGGRRRSAPRRPHEPHSTSWAAKSPEERAKYCTRIAEGLGARMDEIATIVTREAGMPKWLSLIVQAGLPINSFSQAAVQAENFKYEEQIGNSLVVREPVGVVGCITPWNYPLHQIAAKVAYAMAAGCTVVLKPSEIAPLDAYVLAEVDQRRRPSRQACSTSSPAPGPAVGEAIAAAPRHRHGVVHGLDPRRQARGRGGVADAEARRARARRQVRQHPARRPRRREVREGRARRHRQGLPQLGPDLHRADPHARSRSRSWPTPSASRPTRSRPSSSRRIRSPTAPCSARCRHSRRSSA